MADLQLLQEKIQHRFHDQVKDSAIRFDELTIEVLPEDLLAVSKALATEKDYAFEQLIDLTAVDYLAFGKAEWQTDEATGSGFGRGVAEMIFADEANDKRFAVVYHLLSVANNKRLRLKSFVSGEPPIVPSVTSVWSSANWYEREAFDMFGIMFTNHADLRRILTDYGFVGHPLRKDFPTSGHVEVRFDPSQGRVIYQPVTIEPRVLVPKVIREDHRYQTEQQPVTKQQGE